MAGSQNAAPRHRSIVGARTHKDGHCGHFQCPKLAPMPIAAESGQSIGFGTSGVRENRNMRAHFEILADDSSCARHIGRAVGYGSRP
jgi:hypothetical protein